MRETANLSTLSTRLKSAIGSIQTSYEPDLTSEAGAQEFLERLKGVSEPRQQRSLKDLLVLRGHQYYAAYITIVTVALVFVIFPMLAELGPAGRYNTDWVHPTAMLILDILVALTWLYMMLGFGHAWLLGGSLTRPAEPFTSNDEGQGMPQETTLKQCVLELKYLIDTLNDKVSVINQTLSYFIPALLFLYVATKILSGADPTKDNTPIAIITYASSLIVGTFAVVMVIPLRFVAHSRLSKYRKWVKHIEALLITGRKDSIKESS